MEMLSLIVALSSIMWYVIDRFKPLWADVAYGKYITIALSAFFGFMLAFGYNIDLICALELTGEASVIGMLLTGLMLMCGSSAVSEIIGRIKGDK